MKFLTGIDYPHVCSICRSAIDDAAIPYQSGEMPDTDNDEAAIDFVYDNNLYCGGHECVNKGGDAFDTAEAKHEVRRWLERNGHTGAVVSFHARYCYVGDRRVTPAIAFRESWEWLATNADNESLLRDMLKWVRGYSVAIGGQINPSG